MEQLGGRHERMSTAAIAHFQVDLDDWSGFEPRSEAELMADAPVEPILIPIAVQSETGGEIALRLIFAAFLGLSIGQMVFG